MVNCRRRSSKDWISEAARFRLQLRQWLICSSNLDCVSFRTFGCQTRRLRLPLSRLRQKVLHCNGFAGIQPDAAAWFTERGALGAWFSEPPNNELGAWEDA